MRVALLSVLDNQSRPRTLPAPFRVVAGARLVERQLDIALAAGCETIACLALTVGREVIELQHRAEAAGARFIVIREPRKLSGMVTAQDELLVMAPGILPEEDAVLRHLARPGVLTFPEDPAVQRGYERIDANFAWAGVLLVRGNALEELAQLPADVDTPSALLRIALQCGARPHPLETRLLDDDIWLRDPSPEQISARERSWVAGHADVAPFTAPGLAVAERMGARLARDTLGSGLSRALAIGSGVAGVLGLGLTLAGWIAPGFGFAVLAALLLAMEAVVRRVSTAGQVRPRVSLLVQALTVLMDPIFVLMVAVASPQDTQWLRLFVPVVLIGLLHLGERLAVPRWRRSYQDRVLLSVLFMPAALFGVIQPFVAFLALVVMITLFLTSQPRD